MSDMSREISIINVLSAYGDKGVTVAQLSQILNRTGGDITKGVSVLIRMQKPVSKITEYDVFTKRRTVRYILGTEQSAAA